MKENKNENIIEMIIKNEKLKLSDFTKLFNPKIETAAKVGIDNKNDILAESYLLNFNALAPVIEIPDLLTPGTNDKIWRKPITIADFNVKFKLILFLMSDLSLKKSNIPKINVVQPITLIFLISSIKLNLINKYPAIITGKEPIKIFKNKFLFWTKLNISFLKKTITAKNEPICKLTSISKFLLLNSKYSEKIIKWEEELIGKNSVTPCIKDRIIISTMINNFKFLLVHLMTQECIAGMFKLITYNKGFRYNR